MQSTDLIDPPVDLPARCHENADEGPAVWSHKAQRRLHAKGPGYGLSITSHLTVGEPVTEAEISLVLAVLGDTIAQVLNPTSATCPTSAPTTDA